jgi:hypothetical protein
MLLITQGYGTAQRIVAQGYGGTGLPPVTDRARPDLGRSTTSRRGPDPGQSTTTRR